MKTKEIDKDKTRETKDKTHLTSGARLQEAEADKDERQSKDGN